MSDITEDGDVDSVLHAALALLDDVQSPLAAAVEPANESDRREQQLRDDWPFDGAVDELLSIGLDDDNDDSSTFLAMSLFDSEQQQLVTEHPIACDHSASALSTISNSSSSNATKPSTKRHVRAKRSTIAASSSSSAAGRPKSYSNPNKARNERREEVIYLRKKVTELEQQLAIAKQRQQKQLGPSSADAVAAVTPSSSQQTRSDVSTSDPSVWAEIVRRQQSQRAKAERENIRLKLVLENQLKIAKSLEKMVQKSSCTKEFDKVLPDRQRFVWAAYSPPPPPQAADTRLIDELLAGLDQSYVEAESVFEANGLARGVGDVKVCATIHTNDSGGVQLGIVASKVLPFDMRAAGAVVWNHFAFAKDRLPNRMYHHNAPQMLNAAEDTVIEDFNLEVVLPTGVAMYRERQVMRKYTEEHRVVIVWRGYSDTMQIADEPTGGMRFFERGYIAIRARDGSSSATGPTVHNNVLQTCFLTTPVLSGTLADADASKIREITDYIIRSAADKIASSHEIIENLLLEQAMKAHKCRSWCLTHHSRAFILKALVATALAHSLARAALDRVSARALCSMPFAVDAAAPGEFTSGSDDDVDHQYLLQVLLDSHDDDATDHDHADGYGVTVATTPTDSHMDVPMLIDALDMELELDELLHDDDDDDAMPALYSDDHSPTGAAPLSMNCSALFTETEQQRLHVMTGASHSGCSITSLDACTSTSTGSGDDTKLHATAASAAPSVVARAPAATTSSASDPGALITRAVAAAITRRRRPRATAAATKKHKAKSGSGTASGSSLVIAASPLPAAGPTPGVTAKKLLKYNSNKARDERREELLYLRRMASELEAKLAELKIAQPQLEPAAGALSELDLQPSSDQCQDTSSNQSPPAPDTASAAAETTPAAAAPTAMVTPMSVWQEIASRQYEHRVMAERENIRLKLVLEGQVKVAKSLEKLVKKTAALKDFDKCARTERVHYMRPPARDASDAELFAKLLHDVATSYAEVDAVFDAVGLSHMEPSRIDARVQQQRPADRSGSHHIELQVFGSKVLPFDLHATGSAVWHHYVFAKESTPNRLYCHTPAPADVRAAATEEDTIMESFNMEVDVNSTVVLFCMKVVLRRYVEADRVVIVWRAFFDPTHVAHEPLHGVRFLEKGYVVVKKTAAAGTLSDGRLPPHNLLQTCFISTPVSIGDLVHAEPSKVGALTDLVLSSTAANIASSHQMIENVLLAQALDARRQQQQQQQHQRDELPRSAATIA